MISDNKTSGDGKPYRYTISITGEGGEYALFPMTAEQLAYWRAKGEDAVAAHLTGGCDDDETPPEFALGYHYDSPDSTSGIHLEDGADLVVRDGKGQACFEKRLDDDQFTRVDREILHPTAGAAFETYERGTEIYEFEANAPFDSTKLCLAVTDYSTAYVLNRIYYDGQELQQIEEMKPFGTPSVHLFG